MVYNNTDRAVKGIRERTGMSDEDLSYLQNLGRKLDEIELS